MASVKYTPDRGGVAALARSSAVGDACYREAVRLMRVAQGYDPEGDYTVQRATVTGGRNNEARAGAMVSNPSNSGAPVQSLRRAAGNELRH